MLKKLLLTLIILISFQFVKSQCAIEPWTLEKRVDLSKYIIEGKVIRQYPFWEKGRRVIQTASVIEIYKVFKGTSFKKETLEIITFGGQIGLEKHHANPELELEIGDVGIFLLVDNEVPLPKDVSENGLPKFQGTASVQSFISYDFDENKAYDLSGTFRGITTDLYETLQILTKRKFESVKSLGYNAESLKFRPVAGPVITGFGSSSANAGTGDILEVEGQGFGKIQGNGRIEFINADFGDGRRMKTPYADDYTYWSDTLIKVRIPTKAGTGSIKVATNDSGSFTTITGFKINYAHLNATFKPTGANEQYWIIDHINDNNKGGYTFMMNNQFKRNQGMVNSFLRSLETWRCGTFMNWEVGNDTNIKVTASDKVNIVRTTKYTDSRLAVCYSYWNGCYSGGGNMEWFVVELDIEADSSRNWYYGTGNPAGSQYDFQSVLSHELGHGHQLGHVINSQEMMHYSISNGKKKSTLSTNDLAGGLYVKDKSVKINVCSGSRLIALNSNTCGYTQPISGFTVSNVLTCPGTALSFTDTSAGVVKSYLWDFGSGASPSSSSSKGPVSVIYSSSGLKTVKLYVTNDFGTDTSEKVDYITILDPIPSKPSNLKYKDTACLGLEILAVDTPINATLEWTLPTQATVNKTTVNSKEITWTTSGGPYSISVKAINQCGSSDTLAAKVFVYNNPISAFTAVENGREVSFTNASQFADSYLWVFGDGDSSKVQNPVHTYPVGKDYNVTLQSTNRCKTVSASKTVKPVHPAGINGISSVSKFFYPNPVQSTIYLNASVQNFRLFNAQGQLVLEGKNHTLDVSGLAKGIYVILMEVDGEKLQIAKVVKD